MIKAAIGSVTVMTMDHIFKGNQHSHGNPTDRFGGWGLKFSALAIAASGLMPALVQGQPTSLSLVYPPPNHRTTAPQIFLIGSGNPQSPVIINGTTINRSPDGHFAPSFPLAVGTNSFTLQHQGQTQTLTVERLSSAPIAPPANGFLETSLFPATDITRQSNELICFRAIAPESGQVSVTLGDRMLPLIRQSDRQNLPPNAAVLIGQNQGPTATSQSFQGCSTFPDPLGNGEAPRYRWTANGQTQEATAPGRITITPSQSLPVVTVTSEGGVARTGPSTDYSRLTPLPRGTQAIVTGTEGEWLRLQYGAWIKKAETQALPPGTVPPHTTIRSVRSQEIPGATQIIFPLQTPVPITIAQGDREFILTLHHTTAQTDTIYLAESPIIRRLDWQQLDPHTVRYGFQLKTPQQWGYDVRYEGNNLILELRHPPDNGDRRPAQPLAGIQILLDPGHGGEELGARGPNGEPEKRVNLQVSQKLKAALEAQGATVYLSREGDQFLSLGDRMTLIKNLKPTLALSIHYNALPDGGDAENTAGIGMFWYHSQSHDLAQFLHDYVTEDLDRPSYGVYWNNLALTRPHSSIAVLMELGFMINPWEFEWITDETAQNQLAQSLAEGIVAWFDRSGS